jgi:hypothetical protein
MTPAPLQRQLLRIFNLAECSKGFGRDLATGTAAPYPVAYLCLKREVPQRGERYLDGGAMTAAAAASQQHHHTGSQQGCGDALEQRGPELTHDRGL